MYTAQGQMMGHSMPLSGQSMNIQQNTQPLMQQQNVIQNQPMMQQQPQMVGQQHHQQMMGMTPQQQSMVSQNQANAPQQPIMSQPQMMSQMMQVSGRKEIKYCQSLALIPLPMLRFHSRLKLYWEARQIFRLLRCLSGYLLSKIKLLLFCFHTLV